MNPIPLPTGYNSTCHVCNKRAKFSFARIYGKDFCSPECLAIHKKSEEYKDFYRRNPE
jgi:hypothetical protein